MRKIEPLVDYVPASKAAEILSANLKRRISPRYIYKLKGVRFHRINSRCILYNRNDLLHVTIRERSKGNATTDEA
jgi:hypothetical protein